MTDEVSLGEKDKGEKQGSVSCDKKAPNPFIFLYEIHLCQSLDRQFGVKDSYLSTRNIYLTCLKIVN